MITLIRKELKKFISQINLVRFIFYFLVMASPIQSFYRFLSYFDFFAVTIVPTPPKRDHIYSTCCGKGVSCCLIILFIIIVISCSIRAADKFSPEINYYERYAINPSSGKLDSTNFPMVFALINSYGSLQAVDQSLFDLQINFYSIRDSSLFITKNLRYGVCNSTYNGYNGLYCLSQYDDDFELTEKSSSSISYSYMTIILKLCVNATNSNVCRPMSEINQAISSYYFVVITASYSIDFNNYDNPFIQKISEDIFPLSSTSKLLVAMSFIPTQVRTDTGVVSLDRSTVMQLNKLPIQTSYQFSQSDGVLVSIKIAIDSSERIYTRSYGKLQDVLVFTGAIIAFLFMVSSCLLRPWINYHVMKAYEHEEYTGVQQRSAGLA